MCLLRYRLLKDNAVPTLSVKKLMEGAANTSSTYSAVQKKNGMRTLQAIEDDSSLSIGSIDDTMSYDYLPGYVTD